MRRFLTAFAAAVLMLSLGTANAAEYKKMTIRAATANPQGSLHVVAIDKFKEIVEKESNGAITVQTFYGGSLGDEQANVKQLRNAEIHLAVPPTPLPSRAVPGPCRGLWAATASSPTPRSPSTRWPTSRA